MVEYCKGPDHVNDAVDLAVMCKNTLKNSTSMESVSHPKHMAERDLPWETSVVDGKGVSGREAIDKGWAAAKPRLEYVVRRSETGYFEEIEGQYPGVEFGLPMGGAVGQYISRTAELEHLLRQTMFDEVHGLNPLAKGWIKFLADKGYKDGPSIRKIGVVNMVQEAAISKDLDNIFSSKYLSEWAEAHAKELGIDSYEGRLAYRISVILHEIGHSRGVNSECYLGMLLEEYFSEVLDNVNGAEKERIYKAIVKSERQYAENHRPTRFLSYLNFYRSLKNGDGMSESALVKLIAKYEVEGKSEGYKGKSLSKYVTRRLSKEAGEDEAAVKAKQYKGKSSGEAEPDEQDQDEANPEDSDADGEQTEGVGE